MLLKPQNKKFVIKKIDSRSFRSFGRVIDYPGKKDKGSRNLFCIVLRERQRTGWRIAYLVVKDKAVDKLEQHPHSFESFEPVKGKCLIYLTVKKDPRLIKCFILDRPVILKKGVWHAVVTCGAPAEVKITENSSVKSKYWKV